jgi:hypothetical protein
VQDAYCAQQVQLGRGYRALTRLLRQFSDLLLNWNVSIALQFGQRDLVVRSLFHALIIGRAGAEGKGQARRDRLELSTSGFGVDRIYG